MQTMLLSSCQKNSKKTKKKLIASLAIHYGKEKRIKEVGVVDRKQNQRSGCRMQPKQSQKQGRNGRKEGQSVGRQILRPIQEMKSNEMMASQSKLYVIKENGREVRMGNAIKIHQGYESTFASSLEIVVIWLQSPLQPNRAGSFHFG